MAAPNYNNDLALITDAESTTGWTALGGGAAGLAIGADYAMQGTNCVDKQVSAAEKGQVYNFGTTITPSANTHFFTWIFLATPGVTTTLSARGLTVVAGTSTTAYVQFHVEGLETYGAVGRVARCYPIRYNNTTLATPPYRTLTGAPGANPQYFGSMANITATVKGANLGVDAIRHGTGLYITQGDSTNPINFSGSAAYNDEKNNRYGIFSYISGNSYELQGRYVIGQSPNTTLTASYFKETGKSLLIVNTPHSLPDFSQIIIDHSGSYFEMENCGMTAGGTNNKGRLVFNNTSSIGKLLSSTFDGIGRTQLNGFVTASNSTWNNCEPITQSNAIFDTCTLNNTTLLCNDPAKVSDCRFVGKTGGTYGMVITVTGSYNFAGNLFEGFGGSGSASSSIYNASGGSLTLNITNGGDTPTYTNSGSSTTTINNAVALTVNLVDNSGNAVTSSCEVTIVKSSDTTILYEAEDVISGTTQYLYNYTVPIEAYINVLNIDLYEPKTVSPVNLTSENQTITIQLEPERGKYNNP